MNIKLKTKLDAFNSHSKQQQTKNKHVFNVTITKQHQFTMPTKKYNLKQ